MFAYHAWDSSDRLEEDDALQPLDLCHFVRAVACGQVKGLADGGDGLEGQALVELQAAAVCVYKQQQRRCFGQIDMPLANTVAWHTARGSPLLIQQGHMQVAHVVHVEHVAVVS